MGHRTASRKPHLLTDRQPADDEPPVKSRASPLAMEETGDHHHVHGPKSALAYTVRTAPGSITIVVVLLASAHQGGRGVSWNTLIFSTSIHDTIVRTPVNLRRRRR
ncbi:hypothetical protein CCUS01_08707 [Colletotrichum cuscutae]|uniref:Uncharacterized protein n=1 Tax=Colletotrichum cuscutae TaxID=1209917 RepID=A0AAI9XR60_9PEZI|nr:hypothetical protein CCUS01_08707 [Colletotrichum cuscutae]